MSTCMAAYVEVCSLFSSRDGVSVVSIAEAPTSIGTSFQKYAKSAQLFACWNLYSSGAVWTMVSLWCSSFTAGLA